MSEVMEIPEFANEDEERAFWATHDSADFLDGAEPMDLDLAKNISGSANKWIYGLVILP